jgi:transposase
MNVYGDYHSEEEHPLVTFGYSKDHRPDLKQFMISLICSQDGDVPLLAQTIAGNSSDKTHFLEKVRELKTQIQGNEESYYMVADSALYTMETLQEMSHTMQWITRVPETIHTAHQLVLSVDKVDMLDLREGYFGVEVEAAYAGIPQRWLLVYSEQAFEREKHTLERQITKEGKIKGKELRELASRDFDCECDARAALASLEEKLKYHNISGSELTIRLVRNRRGRPRHDETPASKYRITAVLSVAEEKVSLCLRTKGKFIIATNELDTNKLSSLGLLDAYKGQQAPERGFRLLKDSLFMTQSTFLKSQERIVALGMIMCLCLLIYTLAQRHLRLKLKEQHSYVPSQTGKPTASPTMRWIFQLFEGIHLLVHTTLQGVKELILNLNPVREHILEILGPSFQRIYKNAA